MFVVPQLFHDSKEEMTNLSTAVHANVPAFVVRFHTEYFSSVNCQLKLVFGLVIIQNLMHVK